MLVQKPSDSDLGNSASTLLNIWIYSILVADNILLPILVITILVSKKLSRHPTFINLCLTWIFSGVFSLLLFYTHQYKDSEPPKALCVAQASLLFGIAPMWTAAVFALFYYAYQCQQGQTRQAEIGSVKSWLMLYAPYCIQLMFSAAALVISCLHPNLVSRRSPYLHCDLYSRPLLLVRTIIISIWGISILLLEILLIHQLYRNCSVTRRLSIVEARVKSPVSLIRMLIFGTYVIFGAVVDLISILDPKSILPQIYFATAGMVVFLLFGIQEDILRVWFPCRFMRRLGTSSRYPSVSSTQSHSLRSVARSSVVNQSQQLTTIRPPHPYFEPQPFGFDDVRPRYPAPVWISPSSFP